MMILLRRCAFFLLVVWGSFFGVVSVKAEPLSEADRIALTKKLELIKKQSDERVGGLYRRAIRDFRAAIRSNEDTMALYLKCYEKVNYTDQMRKSQEFRDWKRRNKDRLRSSSMRLALRYQLSWLLLSIEAAKMDGDVSELSQRAVNHLDQIFKHAEELKDHRNILSRNVLNSVFAQAYDLHIKVKDWPKSSLDIDQIYEKVVMPPLRDLDGVESLRIAWKHRIRHRELVFEKWSERKGSTVGMKDAIRSPEHEKFLKETKPALLWKMECDCFKCGDQKASALRMLKHVQKYMSHKDAPRWIEEFQKLVHPTTPSELESRDQ